MGFLNDFFEFFKDAFKWLLVIGVFFAICYFIYYFNTEHIEYIEGHRYIHHYGYNSDQLIHSPECFCFKK